MKRWKDLPASMQVKEVRPYYEVLRRRGFSLFWKRAFDIVVSLVLLVVLSPIFLSLAIAIKLDSRGPVFYRQERVTQYGRVFRIHKFRTMVNGADKKGSLVTVKGDSRITKVGSVIRKCRLDEIGQLLDVLAGDMTFVGTRPEVKKYVKKYSPEMMATLLLPAGVTSEASILFKDEDKLLDGADDVDKVYIEEVLPRKMFYNLRSIQKFGFLRDVGTMVKTVMAVAGKEYAGDPDGEMRFSKEVLSR